MGNVTILARFQTLAVFDDSAQCAAVGGSESEQSSVSLYIFGSQRDDQIEF